MRLLSVLLTACSVLLLAACGSESPPATPTIDQATARQLAAESDAIADARDPCAAARRADELQRHVEEAIAGGHVPPSLAPELRRNARALVHDLNCPPPPEDDDDDDHGNRGKDGDGGNGGHGKGGED